MVQFDNVGNGANSLLELSHLFEVTAKFDQRRRTESVGINDQLTVAEGVEVGLDQHEIRAGLDRQETSSWNVDTVSILEMLDGGTHSSLELNNADISFTLLVGGDGFVVGNDFHLELVGFHHTLDGSEVHPDVVGVEVLELLDRLELVDVLFGHLGDFQQSCATFVVNDSTTLDVSLCLVGQLHNVLGLALDHVLENAQVDNSAQVVSVGQEDDFDASVQEFIQDATVVERFKHVTVAGRVPVGQLGVRGLGRRQERILEDTGISGLVEGHDVDVVALVLLDNGRGIFVCVETVHEDKGDIDIIGAVEVLNLSDGEIEEGHAVSDFNDGLGTDATHRSTETTVEFDNSEFVQELNGVTIGQAVIVDNLVWVWGVDFGPVDGVALGSVVEISSEEGEEVVHFGLETLLLCRVGDGIGKAIEGIPHLAGGNIGRGVFKRLHSRRSHQRRSLKLGPQFGGRMLSAKFKGGNLE